MIIRKDKKFKTISIISTVVILVIGIVFILNLIRSNNSSRPVTSPDSKINKVDYGPPTKQEQAAGDAQKEQDIARQKQIDQSAPPSSAQVVITDASYQQFDGDVVEVRSYVSNIFEDGGQCTATLTLGSQTVSQTSAGFKDARTTQCTTISIPRVRFPTAGSWRLIVRYTSGQVTGQSSPVTVVIK